MVIDFVNLFVTRIDAIEYKSLFTAAETMYAEAMMGRRGCRVLKISRAYKRASSVESSSVLSDLSCVDTRSVSPLHVGVGRTFFKHDFSIRRFREKVL